jgi:hypothetical protein
MKKILFLVGLLFTVATASAQAVLDKGGLQLNGKLGISGWGVPVAIGVDYGITPEITVGGELSARFYNTTGLKKKGENYYGFPIYETANFTHSIFGIFANGNYHFHKLFKLPSKVDVYAGASLGFFVASNPAGYEGSSFSGFGWGIQTGGRYFFTDKFGVLLEIGGGLVGHEIKAGVTYKL